MPGWLKQSTTVTKKIGPFLDDTDFKTAETALTIQKADVRLTKNGGDYAAANADQGASDVGAPHDELGEYDISLNTTDTGTLGSLRAIIKKTGALVVWDEWMVVPANVWDSYFGADLLQVDNREIGGDAQSSADLKDFVDSGYDPATNKVEGVKLVDTLTTYTGNTPQTGDVFPLVSTEIADIKAKTDNLPSDPADQSLIIAATDAVMARLGTPAGASVSVDIAAVKTGVDAVPTATANADALLKRDWTSVTGEAARSVLNALRFLRNKWSISGTTLTVTKEDDITSAWTGVLTVDAAADPITANDPA